jgi:site-specific recombinase XerD
MNTVTALNFGSLLQRFFVERLMQQRHASTRTLTAYRDAFKLLLAYLEKTLKKRSAQITLDDLSAPRILGFLNYLEHTRHNSIRTRNARFAAIRSFLHYTASQHPTALALAQPVLALSMKRFERPLVGSLSREEVEAILEAPDPKTWIGQRDRVMLTTLYNSGARVSELTTLRVTDISFGAGAAVQILGKGRKQRQVPLWPATARLLKRWLRSYPRTPEQPLFTSRSGHALTRIGVARRLKLAAARAAKKHPQLAKRRIFPHLFRHALALHLLQSGVDINVIALWLGHESPVTTHMYLDADLKTKERALKKLRGPTNTPLRYRPADRLLEFLQGL